MICPEKELIPLLRDLGLTLSIAESCTGGLVAKRITDIPGSSSVFPGGIVSYCDRVKHQILGVSEKTLDAFTAVSEQTAKEMALGVCAALHTDIGLSTTGYDGPGDEEVGLVYVAIAMGGHALCHELRLSGDRSQIRDQAADHLLSLVLSTLNAF